MILNIILYLAIVGLTIILWSITRNNEEQTDEILRLTSENRRLEKAAKAANKEPSVVEALAALQAKCRRTRYAQKCPDECERCLRLYCSESTTLPCNIADSVLNYQDGAEISKAIEQKTNEYREGNS